MSLDKDRFALVEAYIKSDGYNCELLSVENNVTSVTAVLKNESLEFGKEYKVICNSDLIAFMWRVFSS